MMHLSKRMEKAASLVAFGNRLADIGCDHAYISIYLVENGICPSAIASDVRKGPLERAKEHIKEHGLEEKIETRLGDGLSTVAPKEADTILMTGIGGLLMIRILSEGRETAHSAKELILSPQSDLEEVRRFLKEDGDTIVSESVLSEEGKDYFIFRVIPLPDERSWEPEEYLYGKDFMPDTVRAAVLYLENRIRKLNGIREMLETAKEGSAEARQKEIEKETQLAEKRLEEVKREYELQ